MLSNIVKPGANLSDPIMLGGLQEIMTPEVLSGARQWYL